MPPVPVEESAAAATPAAREPAVVEPVPPVPVEESAAAATPAAREPAVVEPVVTELPPAVPAMEP
jgi:hypothetical protein